MSDAEKAVIAAPISTKSEDLVFIRQMLLELVRKSKQHDVLLAHFVEMAYLHSGDLLSQRAKSIGVMTENSTPPTEALKAAPA